MGTSGRVAELGQDVRAAKLSRFFLTKPLPKQRYLRKLHEDAPWEPGKAGRRWLRH
jgi:hypothetical protein